MSSTELNDVWEPQLSPVMEPRFFEEQIPEEGRILTKMARRMQGTQEQGQEELVS